jgi:hypothetical protein
MTCFFVDWPDAGPCSGQLIRAHLVKRQVLRREGHQPAINDPRSWIPVCGGPQGNGGHHGMLDNSRTLRLTRDDLPEGFVELMGELDMLWYLDKHYGESRSARLGAS